jgi:hypothetical protein
MMIIKKAIAYLILVALWAGIGFAYYDIYREYGFMPILALFGICAAGFGLIVLLSWLLKK